MKIAGIAYARFETDNLAATEAFARDFGLLTVELGEERLVMKTSGHDALSYIAHRAERPRFLGFGLAVASEADLDEAEAIHGATDRRTLGTPGGGEAVTLTDPDGFRIDLVYGLEIVEHGEKTPDLRLNSPAERVRHGDNQARRAFGPATLFRLGHIGLFVRDFAASAALV